MGTPSMLLFVLIRSFTGTWHSSLVCVLNTARGEMRAVAGMVEISFGIYVCLPEIVGTRRFKDSPHILIFVLWSEEPGSFEAAH